LLKSTKKSIGADLVLRNGVIYTVDAQRSRAQALAVKDDHIAYVDEEGGVEAWIGKTTRVIDLQGGMALPGFIDAHCHPSAGTIQIYEVSLMGSSSVETYLQIMQDFLGKRPGLKVLRGMGWINGLFPPGGPRKEMLDRVAPHIPALVRSEDGHSLWLNTMAMEQAGITRETPEVPGGLIEREADGSPSGVLREKAMGLAAHLAPGYSLQQHIEGLRFFQEMAHSLGITSVFEAGMLEAPTALQARQALAASGDLRLRMSLALEVQPDDDPAQAAGEIQALEGQARSSLLKMNCAKLFMDGVIEGTTAYLEQPYLPPVGTRGKLLWEPERFNHACQALDAAGVRVHVHSVGDAATRLVLDGFAHARQANGERDSRHAITHLQLINPADISRFAALGVAAVPQPYWFVVDENYQQAVELLGEERANRQYPMRSLLEAGVCVASASDYPVVMAPNPLVAIHHGVQRALVGAAETPGGALVPQERVSVEQMIESFTRSGAFANFMEDEVGSLEVGKMADIVVLDRDLLSIPVEEIPEAKVMLTIFNGEEVYRHPAFGG
jgi:predicted amidohydrolase YtcJ